MTPRRRDPRPSAGHRARTDDAAMLPRGVRIVYEDDDVIVVDKPAGLLTALVDPDERAVGSPNLFGIVKEHCRRGLGAARRRGREARSPGAGRSARSAWIIHRLDKDVSGLLVFAKTEPAFEALKAELKDRRVERTYVAVVEGDPAGNREVGRGDGRPASAAPAAGGTIEGWLIEGRDGIVRSVRSPKRDEAPMRRPVGRGGHREATAQHAVTHWRPIVAGRGCAALEVRLETGRKNQIRAHLRQIGHPLVGDDRYGAASDPLRRIALHATTLAFTHPTRGERASFTSPPPERFWELVGRREAAPMPTAPWPRSSEAPHRPPSPPPPIATAVAPAPPDSWDHVAGWYDGLIGDRGSDLYEQVIVPGTLRLLAPRAGMRLLDVACGQGVLARAAARAGAAVIGVDSAARLVESARRAARGDPRQRFEIADARSLEALDAHGVDGFDAATCVMALMNIEPIAPVLHGIARRLAPGGVLVVVILHPAFRAPGQTSWGWDAASDRDGGGERRGRAARRPAASAPRQYRRVDAYLTPTTREIVMNPGGVAQGGDPISTVTFHRPIAAYVNAIAAAGLVVDAMEEWPSRRRSQPGPRADEENRARGEIPMFLALRARVGDPTMTPWPPTHFNRPIRS